jgi:hypothetical protein
MNNITDDILKQLEYSGSGYFRVKGEGKQDIIHAPVILKSLLASRERESRLGKRITSIGDSWDKWCKDTCILLGMDEDFYDGTCKATRFIETKIQSLLASREEVKELKHQDKIATDLLTACKCGEYKTSTERYAYDPEFYDFINRQIHEAVEKGLTASRERVEQAFNDATDGIYTDRGLTYPTFEEWLEDYPEALTKEDYYKPPINDEAITDLDSGLPCTGCRNRSKCDICSRQITQKEEEEENEARHDK